MLITGAAGNLGGFLARYLLDSDLDLRLMVHRKPLGFDTAGRTNVRVFESDLADPTTLVEPCRGADCVVHFAGVLFAPRPERFLPTTNTAWAGNLIDAAIRAGVGRFVLVSFPHVEGPTTKERPATGRRDLDPNPPSAHATTRLAAERRLFEACEGTATEAVVLRSGTVYAKGVLMVDAARWLMARRLLGVWREPTWYHFLSLADFLSSTEAAIRRHGVRGVYNLGDDEPMTLQEFLDRAAAHWGHATPWRAPDFVFHVAAWCVEAWARVFRTVAPLTRDFIRIGMVPHVMDTSRMRAELLPTLKYPTVEDGLAEM